MREAILQNRDRAILPHLLVNRSLLIFVFIIDDANLDNQAVNPFLYDIFSVSRNPRTMPECHLEDGNGIEHPDLHYNPSEDLTRVYRDVLKFAHKNAFEKKKISNTDPTHIFRFNESKSRYQRLNSKTSV